jgi:hypothetical protein
MTRFILPTTTAKKLSVFALLLLLFVTIGAGTLGSQQAAAASLPTPTIIAAANKCNSGFFGLRPWYYYMQDELGMPKRGDLPADNCSVRCFNIFRQGSPNACGKTTSDIPSVALAVVDDLLRISGLVAVAFILKGSFEYVGSRGNAEKTAAAQSTIMAALTGLAVALVAVAFVSYLGNQLGG